MDFPTPIPVKELIRNFGLRPLGNIDLVAHGINEIHKVRTGDLTFVDSPKYYQRVLRSSASIILIDKEAEVPHDKCLLIHQKPFEIYEKIIRQYRMYRPLESNIHPSATIHPSAVLEPYVVVGAHSHIGRNSIVRAHSFIGDYTEIGDNVFIEPRCSIGSDAFYFKTHKEGYERWTTAGKVVIENDVYIGTGSTIARGVSGTTRIGQGTKLDAQVQLGHGVVLGKNCLLAAQVGIGGKTIVGDHVKIYGQVGIAQSITIGEGCTILGKSGVTKSLEAGKTYFGYPAAEARSHYRQLNRLKRLLEE